VLAILAALVVVSAAPAAADDRVTLAHLLAATVDYDSNVFDSVNRPEHDFLARLFYDFRFDFAPKPAHALTLGAQVGAKKYFAFARQDTLVTLVRVGYAFRGLPATVLGVDVEGKMRWVRDGDEDYGKAIASAYAQHSFEQRFRLRADGEAAWFDVRRYDYFDYWYQRYGLALGKGFGEVVDLELHYAFRHQGFPIPAYTNLGTRDAVLLRESGRRRADNLHEVGADLMVTKWLLARAGYAFQVNASNSYGDSYYNHKVTVALSKAILDPLSMHALFILQVRDAVDPVLIPATLQVEETDESLSQITGKLAYRVTEWVSLEGKYSRFWSQYVGEDLDFVKDQVSVGATFRF
jgi:hypothetical protein